MDEMQLLQPQKEALMKILQFHLENSYFTFNKKFYKQLKGVPIGSVIGGLVACITLARAEAQLEKKILRHKPHLKEFYGNYKRYQDDSYSLYVARSGAPEAENKAREMLEELKSMIC